MWTNKKTRLALRITLFITLFISILLFITGIWLQTTIFNSQNFSNITTAALTSESSRIAIANNVVDRLLEDKPLIRSTAGPRIASVISGVLGTDIAIKSIARTTERLQLLIVTDQKPLIAIDTSQVKPIITQLQNVTEIELTDRFDVDAIPESIIILDSKRVPDLSMHARVVRIMTPLIMMIIVITSLIWIHRGNTLSNRLLRLRYISIIIIAAGMVALMTGPILRPEIINFAELSSGRVVIGNLYDGLMQPFNIYASYALVAGTLALAASFYPKMKAILRRSTTTAAVKHTNSRLKK
jgi:hypothetical protein